MPSRQHIHGGRRRRILIHDSHHETDNLDHDHKHDDTRNHDHDREDDRCSVDAHVLDECSRMGRGAPGDTTVCHLGVLGVVYE